MSRFPVSIPISLLVFAVGCSTCGEYRPLFPRLREAFDGNERETERERQRLRDRYNIQASATSLPTTCLPCSNPQPVSSGPAYGHLSGNPTSFGSTPEFHTGTPMSYSTMPMVGTPVVPGSYAQPYPASVTPILGTPVGSMPLMPSGGGLLPGGSTVRPDNELPQPGQFSTPNAAEMRRPSAPKPTNTLTGR